MSARIFHRILRTYFDIRTRMQHMLLGISGVSRELSTLPNLFIGRQLRRYGAFVGDGAIFKDGIQLDNADGDLASRGDYSNLSIGSRCHIGKGVFFDLPDQIILKEEVILSAGVKILTHSDCGNRPMARWYPRKLGRVVIGRGTWIGANAVILAGVELGEFCVVGANAVVTKSFPAFSVVVGVPARLLKALEAHRMVRGQS